MSTPSFASTIAALKTVDARFNHVRPTDEELDIAVVLEAIEEIHQPTGDRPDYGQCAGCKLPWPCPEWNRGEHLAVLWLGRAIDRYVTRARDTFGTGRTA